MASANDSRMPSHRSEDLAKGSHEEASAKIHSKNRKPPRVRSRASRACDRCKARKTRCSGKYPCTVCSRLDLDCKYTAVYRRGRLPSIEIDTDNHPSASPGITDGQIENSEDLNGMLSPQTQDEITISATTERQSIQRQKATPAEFTSQLLRNSPELAQVDQQGHYVGPASGASFLLRIQRKLTQEQSSAISDSSIFTFGDVPLPHFDPRFLILPPLAEAESFIQRYFEFASATHRFLHRPTIEAWLQELYDTNGNMNDQGLARSKIALLFMVFALAETYPNSKPGKVDPVLSARFFSAAEDQLSGEKGAIRLTSVQARLSQCLFLLSHSRLNHCWSLFGTTAHLMLALGIHRKSRGDLSRGLNHVDLECRKRTFWCAYNVDTYLSAALGRPRTFHDDDIDQELPLCLDDNRISYGQAIMLPTANRQSVMFASIAHIKLSRIVAKILRDLYGIRPLSIDTQHKLAERYAGEIKEWRKDVSYLMDTSSVDPSLLQPIFLRQRNVLNLACWHAQILVHRPFLLRNFASLANIGAPGKAPTPSDQQTNNHVQSCFHAAISIAGKIDELHSSGQLYNTFWFSHYFAFCAVVVLYVFAIQQRHQSMETYLPAVEAALKCQLQIASIAIRGSLAQRYGVVLQELRAELLRHNPRLKGLVSQSNGGRAEGSELVIQRNEFPMESCGGLDPVDLNADRMGIYPTTEGNQFSIDQDGALDFAYSSPDNLILQLTGWGQFDSLATGGMGDLQSILGTEGLGGWDFNIGGNVEGVL